MSMTDIDRRAAELIELGRKVHFGYLGNWLVDYPGRTHGYDVPGLDPRTITMEEILADLEFGNSIEGVVLDWCERFEHWCKENLT